MKRIGAILLLVAVGCSTVPVTDATSDSPAIGHTTTTSLLTDTTTPEESATSDSLADTDLISPVIEWQGGGRSSDEGQNEYTRTVSSCMQQRGWTFEPDLQQSLVPEPRTIGELRDFREIYGYGVFTIAELAATDDPKATADRNDEYFESLGADQQEAYLLDLNGNLDDEGAVPLEGSCEAIARESTEIPLENQAVMTELNRAYEAAFQSSEFLSAMDEHARCLADRGYEGEPSLLVEQQAAAGAPPQQLADFEIEVAVADFECALNTTMPVRHRLETEIVREMVEHYPEFGS